MTYKLQGKKWQPFFMLGSLFYATYGVLHLAMHSAYKQRSKFLCIPGYYTCTTSNLYIHNRICSSCGSKLTSAMTIVDRVMLLTQKASAVQQQRPNPSVRFSCVCNAMHDAIHQIFPCIAEHTLIAESQCGLNAQARLLET